MGTAYATCPLCEALCGIEVETDGSTIASVRGDAEDPLSRGYLCPKAAALKDLHEDPDRLRVPQKRIGDRWVEVPWDEALGEVGARLAAIQRDHGRDAVGLYVGNPTVHSHGAILFGLVFHGVLGTRNLFTSNSVDALPRLLTSLLMYGSQAVLPIADLDRTRFLLVVGANPAVSNGSILTAPGARRRLAEIRARGGRVVVLDPRRTETAELADRHLFVRPGTDALVLAAMVQVIVSEGLSRPGALAPRLKGVDRLPVLLAPFTPEAVAPATGIEADVIRGLARDFAASSSAVAYGRLGTSTQELGTLASWLVDVLNAITGNLDRPGGAMFTTPAIDLGDAAARLGQSGHFDRWRSRVRGLPEFNGELPAATLADEIEVEGPGQIRGLVTHAGNPALSLPNGRRVEAALRSLDLLVSIDIYRNETTRLAHWILPTTTGLERDHYGLVFRALAVRNTTRYAPAVIPGAAGSRHDWQVLLGLATAVLRQRGLGGRAAAAALEGGLGRLGPRGILELLLAVGPHGVRARLRGDTQLSLAELERRPHGVDLGPLEPRLDAVIRTADRRVDLAPAAMVADLPRLARRLRELTEAHEARSAEGALLLIGRRDLRSNNSWMHNAPRLMRGRNRCTLLLHPDDAAARGLTSGARARVTSRVGEVEVEVEVTDAIMRGVASLPHGWGHDRAGSGQRVAAASPGVSVNDLTDDRAIDAVSGVAAFSGVPVRVERVVEAKEVGGAA